MRIDFKSFFNHKKLNGAFLKKIKWNRNNDEVILKFQISHDLLDEEDIKKMITECFGGISKLKIKD